MKRFTASLGRHTAALACLGVAALACLPTARACDVPVYRYALDLWPADAYEAVVAHRGGGEETNAGLTLLRDAAGTKANLVVREALPERPESPAARLLQEHPADSLPWLIIRYPVRNEIRRTLWAGPLTRATAAAWLDSPARQKLSRLLLEGRAGVWVLLEGGNRGQDERARDRLAGELARLERTLRLPAAYATPDNPGPSFALLRLPHDDPQETELIAMLRGSEPDLVQRTDEPMVFPVYGRGLILYALIGDGINASTIAEAAEFMIGSCSCEVKSQNPGLELLLSAAWTEAQSGGMGDFMGRAERAENLLEDGSASATTARGLVADVPADRGASLLSPGASAAPTTRTPTKRSRRLAGSLAAAGAAVLTGVILRTWRRRRGG